jgi:DNA-binding CsgD family transcriptional regulator
MAVLVAISTPNDEDAPDSTPRRIVEDFPQIQMEVVQFEQNGSEAIPYIHVTGVDVTEFHQVLESDSHLSDPVLLESTDDEALYKVVWDVDSPVVYCIQGASGTIVEAKGDHSEWKLKLWFENNDEATGFHQCCLEHDVPLQVNSFVPEDGLLIDDPQELTEKQAQVLRYAYREGYFSKPRDVSQEEIADELGISSPAVSQLLRRGMRNLIKSQLID